MRFFRLILAIIFILLNIHVSLAYNGEYVVILNDTVSRLSDTVPFDKSTHIVFPCNKTYFNKNQETWIDLNRSLTEILNDSNIVLDAIHMYGTASPEGPYNNNIYLSINRRKRVITELEKLYPSISDKIYSYSIPEDYGRLAYTTKDDTLYSNISSLFGENDFVTKSNLQKDKWIWQDLLKRYYPNLRAVNITLYVHEIFKKPIIEIIKPNFKFDIDILEPKIDSIIPSKISFCVRQPMIRLKTNLLYDIVTATNLSLEFLPKNGHITPQVTVIWSGWRNDEIFKTLIIHSYEIGGRYYFNKSTFDGWFLNTALGLGIYDVQTNKKRGFLSKKYQYNNKFELGCGYVHKLGKSNWSVEYTIGFGCIYSKLDKYHGAEDWATSDKFYYNWHKRPENYRKYNNIYKWFGPVNIGVTVSYDIVHYKKQYFTY